MSLSDNSQVVQSEQREPISNFRDGNKAEMRFFFSVKFPVGAGHALQSHSNEIERQVENRIAFASAFDPPSCQRVDANEYL